LSNMNPTNDAAVGMWPFGEVVTNDMQEWMQTPPQMNSNIHSSNVSTDNPMSNINQNRFNSSADFDSTYSMNMSSHVANVANVANSLNYSVPITPMMGLNGVPPHLSSTLYQSGNGGLNVTQDGDYWSAKMGPLSSANANLGNGMAGNQSANAEHKINWNQWNHQS